MESGKRKKLLIKILLIIFSQLIITIGGFSAYYFVYMRFDVSSSKVWDKNAEFDINSMLEMTVESDELKILQVTDLHLLGIFTDKDTINSVGTLIDATNPDLVVVTGDLAFTFNNLVAIKDFADFMEGRKQPWAFVFGNHDSSPGFSKFHIIRLLKNYKYCVFDEGAGNITGRSNYFINIKKDGEIVYNLSFLDSNRNRTYTNVENPTKYDYIYPDQVEWFEWNMNALNDYLGRTVSAMSFFHIPLMEYRDLKVSGEYDGEIGEDETKYGGYGIACPAINTGLFDAMKRVGSTKAVFVGHDHLNTMRGFYEGIYLCYGRSSGLSAYPFLQDGDLLANLFPNFNFVYKKGFIKGGTLISIDLTNDAFKITDLKYGEV